jgi:hypothetical protein
MVFILIPVFYKIISSVYKLDTMILYLLIGQVQTMMIVIGMIKYTLVHRVGIRASFGQGQMTLNIQKYGADFMIVVILVAIY